MKDFEFKSLADLGEDIRTWLGWIPREFEIVVGVPRSGLLIANMISLHRHLPMTDVDGLASGRLIGGGNRFDVGDPAHFLAKPRRVLVVDDSVLTGRQMANVRSRLSRAPVRHDLSYAAVYVDPGKEDCVDYFHQALPFPRMFEWNLMHHPMLERACVDIDGVLCRDPTDVENDDGSRYADFLGDVTARVKPAFPIGTLVTCRLEKYRSQTEDWLTRNGIQWRHLVMMPYASKAERIAANRHAEFKAEAYLAAHAMIFIESSVAQARAIADISARYVIATDRMKLFAPSVRTKRDILDGLRGAGSFRARARWLRSHRRAIAWWIKRRRNARRSVRARGPRLQ
jgi:orotate phosphoribosyltransferase